MSVDNLLATLGVPSTGGAAGVFIAGTDPGTGLPIVVHQIFDPGSSLPRLTSMLFPLSEPEGQVAMEIPIREDLQRERESLTTLMAVLRGLHQRCMALEGHPVMVTPPERQRPRVEIEWISEEDE